MKRYTVETAAEGTTKYFYIMDGETLEIALLPSKYLKHKIKANLSPNTVKRYAFSLCCYMEYMAEKELEFPAVCGMGYEEQSSHFTQFLYWLKEGCHTEKKKTGDTDNGTCNAYLKDVFGFYLFMAECGYVPSLRVLSYSQITVPNAAGVKRTLRCRSFGGYMKAEERNVRAAREEEIIATLQALYEYLKGMGEEEWNGYRENAERFLASEFAASYGETAFADVLVPEIVCWK